MPVSVSVPVSVLVSVCSRIHCLLNKERISCYSLTVTGRYRRVEWTEGTVVQWYSGTLLHCYTVTLLHWYTGTLVHKGGVDRS